MKPADPVQPPSTDELLANAQGSKPKPVAFVVAGHNGSGKSTLWYERLASKVQMPLVNAELSMLRVESRKRKGGHDVPVNKLRERFPRTQAAVGHATGFADMTLMFDNSRTEQEAFALVRAQKKNRVLFDVRDERYKVVPTLRSVAGLWLPSVVGAFS